MTPFEFTSVTRMIFGRGQFGRIGELARSMGTRAMILHNVPSVDKLLGLLESAGVGAVARVQKSEPVVADIEAALVQARDERCDIVIGIGGGSAIDAAKATASLLANGGSPVDYMEVVGKGQKINKPSVPFIAIPTTAGTGAEATRNAVIGLPEKHFKASIRSELMLPRIALIDPELAIDVPPEVTASSGMDALCQCIESYTSTGAGPLTDVLALEGVTRAARSLVRAYRNGHDLDARENMALAAYLSGVTLTNAGLGAVHGFAAPLGANFPVPHGTVCAALLPHVIRANIRALRESPEPRHAAALARYAVIGRRLADDDTHGEDDAMDACITTTANLARTLRIPPLSNYGLAELHVPEMVALAKKASSMRYNPIALSDAALAEALLAAITPESR